MHIEYNYYDNYITTFSVILLYISMDVLLKQSSTAILSSLYVSTHVTSFKEGITILDSNDQSYISNYIRFNISVVNCFQLRVSIWVSNAIVNRISSRLFFPAGHYYRSNTVASYITTSTSHI